MKKAFRDAYDHELSVLKERAKEFAADYPGLADRLGGLLEENLDPAVAGLLEGTAFMSARVQLKMREEFRSFTREYLDQVFPDALAPTPSAMLVSARVPFDNSDLVSGLTFPAGSYLDARFQDADKRVSCRFSLSCPLTLWPLLLDKVTYHGAAGPVSALGQEIAPGTKAGLSIELARADVIGQPDEASPLSGIAIDELPIYFTGPMPEATALYEQIHCDRMRVSIRHLNAHGDPVFQHLPPHAIQQIGFGADERLFPHEGRHFNGFAILREMFAFPRHFLGLKLTGLREVLANVPTGRAQIVFEFGSSNAKLAARLETDHLRIHAAPAINLFEEISSQVKLDKKRHEFVVTPNSSPSTHYEMHQITEVHAYYPSQQEKVEVFPLYALPPEDRSDRQTLYYTTRRKPRRLTLQERRFGGIRYRYRGTETFISIYEPPDRDPAHRLQVRGLCSNRHLPEYLPIAQGQDDFHLSDDQTVTLSCIAGPSAPRESLADLETDAPHRTQAGDVYWRLMSYLTVNQFGIEGRTGTEAAAALREVMSLFADLSDKITAQRLQGLKTVETRPVTRTIAHPEGFFPARGLEISLTFDENEFEGSGCIIYAAAIDRFLAEYAAVNSLTQCVVYSLQRGRLMTFPPRGGSGPIL